MKEAWKYQEDFDSSLVKGDTMTTFVKFDNAGMPFMTLAGLAKLANRKGVVIVSMEVTDTGKYYQGIASGHLKDNTQEMRWGGHTEPKVDHTGEDMFAFAKCVSKTQRNLFRMLLYGDADVQQLLDDFVENNTFNPEEHKAMPPQGSPPPATPRSTPASDTRPATHPQNEKGQQETQKPDKPKTIADECREIAMLARPTLMEMAMAGESHGDKSGKEIYTEAIMYHMARKPKDLTDDMFQVMVEEFSKDEFGCFGAYFKERPADADEYFVKLEKVYEQMLEEPGHPENKSETPQSEDGEATLF